MSPLTSYLVETLVTLVAIVVLAVLVLAAARRAGIGRPSGPVALVGRLPLDGRRAVYLIRAGNKVLVVGASEAGLAKLGELEDGELSAAAEPVAQASGSFGQVLARVMGRAPAGPRSDPQALIARAVEDGDDEVAR